eukprot:gnl/MRDRNA2_/MRDRNA2_117483_c0_seq1.p1 gnl/MRDRNA2_/MRDRNA2_117483_c0~~gnl/MRDRNA2_/MRDRNA2_117483_c0_seq1.p1  ORF type:complete len:292 (+),score=77.72 gnl/MRDRNA2_/MRDRNA2_117483_c0_seq1:84-959(+)
MSEIQGPTDEGNRFDVRMSEEPDGLAAAERIAEVLKEYGVCLVEANAPHDLLTAAYDECGELWKDGAFKPPLEVYDDVTMQAAMQSSRSVMKDEKEVVWIGTDEVDPMRNALKILAGNIRDFGTGLIPHIAKLMDMEMDRSTKTMLSRYAGDRRYSLHMDNPWRAEEGEADNGIRLSLAYYINPHWDPSEEHNGGGMDFYLTDPSKPPPAASEIREATRLRIAPHADTLVLFLSERMAHEVLTTNKDDEWFLLTCWFMGPRPKDYPTNVKVKPKYQLEDDDKDEDDDGPDL